MKCKAEERDLFSEAFKVKSFMKVEGRGCRASFFTFIWSIGRSIMKEPSIVHEQRRVWAPGELISLDAFTSLCGSPKSGS